MTGDTYRRPSGVHPPLAYPAYRSTVLRAPSQPLVWLPQHLTEVTGPLLGYGAAGHGAAGFGADRVGPADHDLTAQHDGEPLGQRIIVHGRVIDGDGRAVPDTLLEIWQANASGRYRHVRDGWPAPIDPNFTGLGRTLSDAAGRYRFVTVRPGAYPWGNHDNAWRPAHIHFSLFGRAFTQRLVTQMYFPDDPLFAHDPIFQSVPEERGRARLVSRFDLAATEPSWALAYEFIIVLRGSAATPMEDGHDD